MDYLFISILFINVRQTPQKYLKSTDIKRRALDSYSTLLKIRVKKMWANSNQHMTSQNSNKRLTPFKRTFVKIGYRTWMWRLGARHAINSSEWVIDMCSCRMSASISVRGGNEIEKMFFFEYDDTYNLMPKCIRWIWSILVSNREQNCFPHSVFVILQNFEFTILFQYKSCVLFELNMIFGLYCVRAKGHMPENHPLYYILPFIYSSPFKAH